MQNINKYFPALIFSFFLIFIFTGHKPLVIQAAECQVTAFWRTPSGDFSSLPSSLKPKVGDKYTAVAKFVNCQTDNPNAPIKGQLFIQRPAPLSVIEFTDSITSANIEFKQEVTFNLAGGYSIRATQGIGVSGNPSGQTPALAVGAADPGPNPGNNPPPPTQTTPPPPDTSQTPGATGTTDPETIKPPVNIDSVGQLISIIIKYFLTLIAALAVLFIIVGGFRMVTSEGNEQAVAAGKKTVSWAIIGLLITLMAFTIVTALLNLLGGSPPAN